MRSKKQNVRYSHRKTDDNKFDLTQLKIYFSLNKIIFIFSIFTMSFIAPCKNSAQTTVNVCCYYDGYWGEWHPIYTEIYGSYSGFILYGRGVHKSNYFFSFQISNSSTPTKKEIKDHRKNKKWFEYEGTVEYWVHEDYPTIKDVFKKWGCPRRYNFESNYSDDKKPTVKRVAKAIIKIAPYKKRPKCYNIYFDGVGFAIDLGDLYWK